jgi:hypothetical protein
VVDEKKDEGTSEVDSSGVAPARRSMTDEEYRVNAEEISEELEQLLKDDDSQ